MVRLPTLMSLWGMAVLLAACEPAAQNAAAGASDDEAAVLPGTQTSRDFGDFVVHFNALRTDQLTPDIAGEYGIVRSRNRAMLNVSILKKNEGGMATPVPGSVTTSAINLTGQLKSMAMREITEGDAIYYIGETAVADGETLVFTIDVTPINDPSRYTVRFMKQFFVD